MSKNRCRLYVEVSYADITDEIIQQMTYEQLLKLVKEIDKAVADYGFTRKLRDYFVKEMEKEDADDRATVGVFQ
jgi:hypothetical protein